MKKSSKLFWGVCLAIGLAIAFTGCFSVPKFDKMNSKQEEGKIQVYFFTGPDILGYIFSDPVDIEQVKQRDFSSFNSFKSVMYYGESINFDPVIIPGGAWAGSITVGVFNIPEEIMEVCVLAARYNNQYSQTSQSTAVVTEQFYWTQSPWFISIDNQEKIQGYMITDDGKYFSLKKLTVDQIKAFYSKSKRYAFLKDEKHMQPGFIIK